MNEEEGRKAPNLEKLGNRHKTDMHPGWWVVLHLVSRPGRMPSRVGQVQSLTERGLRITEMNFVTGEADLPDLWVPWSEILSAQVITDEHYLDHWDPGKLQSWINEANGYSAHRKEVAKRIDNMISENREAMDRLSKKP